MCGDKQAFMVCVAGGKQRYLGSFGTAEKAAEAYAKETLQRHSTVHEENPQVNCTQASTESQGAPASVGSEVPFDMSPWRSSQNATGYKGVRVQGRGYAAQIFTGEIEPARTFLVAV